MIFDAILNFFVDLIVAILNILPECEQIEFGRYIFSFINNVDYYFPAMTFTKILVLIGGFYAAMVLWRLFRLITPGG